MIERNFMKFDSSYKASEENDAEWSGWCYYWTDDRAANLHH